MGQHNPYRSQDRTTGEWWISLAEYDTRQYHRHPNGVDMLPEHSHDHHHHMPSALLTELREHVPFSVLAVTIGLIVAGTLCIFGDGFHQSTHASVGGHMERTAIPDVHDHESNQSTHEHGYDNAFAQSFFHLFHPAHMLFSAAATTAMFFRYERKWPKAIFIGLVGAIGVCGMSDIVMPQISLSILDIQTPWHICLWEHTDIVLPFAIIGSIIGLAAANAAAHSTLLSHSMHVLASTMASIFYMVGPLGIVGWIDVLGKVFLFVVLAVMVPCCLSDIVFPLLMSRANRDKYFAVGHAH